MNPALRIFCKDVRYLRLEISLLLLLAAAFAWVKVHIRHDEWSGLLLELAAVYLIARAVHADAIPGDRQFWLTRPYRCSSLAAAKLLFVVVCVALPIGCAQLAIALADRFPLASTLPGLLWTQVLIVAAAIPVVALGAVTASIVPFILVVLALALIAFEGTPAVMYWFPGRFGVIPVSVDWVRDLAGGAALLALAALVVFWQYRSRATHRSRITAIAGLNLIAALLVLMPRAIPLTIQSWLSHQPDLAAPVAISLQPADRPLEFSKRSKPELVFIPLVLKAGGVPAATELRSDGVSLTLEWPGRTWQPKTAAGVNRRHTEPGAALFDATLPMDPEVFRGKREAPLVIRGSIFLTLFGDEQQRTVHLGLGPVNVQDGLQCRSDQFSDSVDVLLCSALFRWPSRLVYARSGDEESDFSNSHVSYSPFPAEMSLDTVETRWGDPIRTEEITIVTKKPLVHFHRDFELRGIKLADFEARRGPSRLP